MHLKILVHKLLRYIYSLRSDTLLPIRLQAWLDIDNRSILSSKKDLYSTTITQIYSVLAQTSIDIWSETRSIVQEDLERLSELQQHKKRLDRKLTIEEPLTTDEESEEDRIYRLRKQLWIHNVKKQNDALSDAVSSEISKLRSRIRHEEMIAEQLVESKRKKCLVHLQQYYDLAQKDDDTPIIVNEAVLQYHSTAGYENYYRGYEEVLHKGESIPLTVE